MVHGVCVAVTGAMHCRTLGPVHPDEAKRYRGASIATSEYKAALECVQEAWDVHRGQVGRAQRGAQLAAQRCSEQFEGVPSMKTSVNTAKQCAHDVGNVNYEFTCRCGEL